MRMGRSIFGVPMNIDLILYILAGGCLLADAFSVPVSVKLFSMAAALLVLSLIV